jgi:hypothetical protein
MTAKQAGRDRGHKKETDQDTTDNRYVADWDRKSREQIVREEISALDAALKKATQKAAPAS